MRLKKEICVKCKKEMNCDLEFKGFGFLFLSGVRCSNCGHKYGVKGMLKGMSLQYVDVIVKLMFLANGFYFILLKYYMGFILTIAVIMLLNYVIYPLFFKLTILRIDTRNGD